MLHLWERISIGVYMAYQVKSFSLKEFKEHAPEVAEAARSYFVNNPKKTTYKVGKKFTVRKDLNKVGYYEIHPK